MFEGTFSIFDMTSLLRIRHTYLLILALLGFGQSKATHIVGGEIMYQYLGSDYYEVTMYLFIDCYNGADGAIQADATAYFAVFDGNSKSLLDGYPILVSRTGPVRITKVNYNCIKSAPANACVDKYQYKTTMHLPPITGGYYISFQRCCRNNTISNIVNPENTGANYWTHVPDARTLPNKKPNSSAFFKSLPPNFICTNTILKFDHSAIDLDGDSLAYDLFTPYYAADPNKNRPDNGSQGYFDQPPFRQLSFNSGYTYDYPIDGNPGLTIDPEDGRIWMIPTKEGQYVVGIRVREYRKGVLISETKRDYQFNVGQCVVEMVAAFFSPKIICGFTHRFDNKSQGADRYHWDFGVNSTNADTSNRINPEFTFPTSGKYKVVLVTYKNDCTDTFDYVVQVEAPIKPKIGADTLICVGNKAKFSSDFTGDSYRWNTGATTKSIMVGNQGLYWLDVTLRGCTWRDSVYLTVDQNKVKGFGDTIYCTYDTFDRWLTSTPGFFNYRWNTGSRLDRIQVDKKGDYIVSAVTVNGCPSSDTIFVEHYPPVVVEIEDTTVCKNIVVVFDAKNTDATRISWSTGDSGRYFKTAVHGQYHVLVSRDKCHDRDTFILNNFPDEFELGNNLKFCSNIDTVLTINEPFKYISWANEVPGKSYHLTKPGKIVVFILNSNNCPESDSIYVSLFPNPGLNLGADTVVCASINPVLNAGEGMEYYHWQDGFDQPIREAIEAGEYWVEVKDIQGCKSRDTVIIEKNPNLFPSQIYMPNAFTPDGNLLNDLYPDNKYHDIGTMYNLKLYNRWGEKIYEGFAPGMNWDGTINGYQAAEGVYIYLISWIGCDNVRRTLYGDFSLLR